MPRSVPASAPHGLSRFYNAEFYVLDTTRRYFLNSSFGIGPEVAQTGPSIFPITALAGRVKYQPVPLIYVMADA